MATGTEVLQMLRPNDGWAIIGDDFDSIRYEVGVEPLTQKEFENGFAQVDAWKASQQTEAAAAKAALLAKLGITEDEAKLLLS